MKVFAFLWEIGIFIIKEELHNLLDTVILHQKHSNFLLLNNVLTKSPAMICRQKKKDGSNMYPLGKMRRAFPNRKIRNLSLFHENPHSKTTKPIAHFGFGFDVFLQHHMWV